MIKRLPEWLRRPVPHKGESGKIESILADSSLNTVCEEAKCPNRAECYSSGTATFMVMGERCSRSCRFCSVQKGNLVPLNRSELDDIIEAVICLNLKHVVITSVTRDDLSDGGSEYLAEMCRRLKDHLPHLTVEMLVPDFLGNFSAIETVVYSGVDVFAHNIEMVPRLYKSLRPEAQYGRSLEILKKARELSTNPIKTGIMVGLGETNEELFDLLRDIAAVGVDIVTIGQYLQPSPNQVKVHRFVTPAEFEIYRAFGSEIGIPQVVAGPYVRSSYRAIEVLNRRNDQSMLVDRRKTC